MNDLPDLAFEHVLAYLDLKELLRTRAVSKWFCLRIDNYKVRSLFLSELESGYIEDKHRLVVGEFVQNSIKTLRFELFFASFGKTLSGLRRLRVCNLDVKEKATEFTRIVNSFELECLDLVRVKNLCSDLKLTLLRLKCIRLENLRDYSAHLTLNAPRLTEMWVSNCYVGLSVIHPESIQTLEIPWIDFLDLENFRNLKFLYCNDLWGISDSLFASLEHLKEIHFGTASLEELHDQRRRYDRSELKLYYRGVCFASPHAHPASITWNLCNENLRFMAANYSLLADRIPVYNGRNLSYSHFESAVPEMPSDFWGRLIGVREIEIAHTVENVEQFLIFLRNCSVYRLCFKKADQPPGLFEQLPRCCSPEFFSISNTRNLDVSFLFEFEDLNELSLDYVDFDLVQKLLRRLKFIRCFWFDFCGRPFFISANRPKRLLNSLSNELGAFTDLDQLIDFLCRNIFKLIGQADARA